MSAVTYGREGIANCFDASRARARGEGSLGLDFVFRQHKGVDAKHLRGVLGLELLTERTKTAKVSRKQLGLSDSDCLDGGSMDSLKTLVVSERRGGGLPGALSEPESVLARALIAVGRAQQSAGAAGSYGYGKAAVAQASKIRSLIAYSCFEPQGHDRATRRLLGVTYWGEHIIGGALLTGWALFGRNGASDGVSALEDHDADAMASAMGLDVRRPEVEDDLGTTFLLVDPAFTPQQLLGAIELSWWPLLQRTRDVTLDITVTDYDGTVSIPEVGVEHKVLGQFVRAFLEAEAQRDSATDVTEPHAVVRSRRAGITSLTLRDPASPIDQSLVALMRSPLMVVRYEPQKNANPPLVGVFVSHDTTNDNLRMVEPPEHDKWHAANVGGLNARTVDIEISKAVRQELTEAVRVLHGPDPEPVFGISAFAKHFPAVDLKVARPKPPKPPRAVAQRLVRVHLVHESANELVVVERPTRIVVDHGLLAARAEVKFFLDSERAKKVGLTRLDATLTIGARIAEEGAKSWENLPAAVQQFVRGQEQNFNRTSPDGVSPAVFEGRFARADAVYFTILTEPYPADWTVEIVFDCSPWDLAAPVAQPGARKTED